MTSSSTPPPAPTVFPVIFRFVIEPAGAVPTLPSSTGPLISALASAVGGLDSPLVPGGQTLAYSATAEMIDVRAPADVRFEHDVRLVLKYVLWNQREVRLPASLRLDGPSELTFVVAPAYRVTLVSRLGTVSFTSGGEIASDFVLDSSTVHYRVADRSVGMSGLWGALGGTHEFMRFEDEHGAPVAGDEIIRSPLRRVAVWDDDFGLPALAIVGLGILIIIVGRGLVRGHAVVVTGAGKITAKPDPETARLRRRDSN